MASIKKESFGKLSDGREAAVYTLRNTKGNELKVTDFGARIISMRFRNKDFENKFMLKTFADVSECEKNFVAGLVYVDDSDDFGKIIWNSEQIDEGVKFSAESNGKSAEIIYSLSNDNEISIKYSASGAENISANLIFSAESLPDAEITPFADGAQKEKISSKNYNIIDKPAEVEMEVGMFGYDPGCPIDYLEAGLKNAADIFSESAGIALKIYTTQNELHVAETAEGFSVKTHGANSSGGKIQSQTVCIFKNRK